MNVLLYLFVLSCSSHGTGLEVTLKDLVLKLESDNFEDRNAAESSFARLKLTKKQLAAQVGPLVSSSKFETQMAAIRILDYTGTEGVPFLLKGANDSDSRIRFASINHLTPVDPYKELVERIYSKALKDPERNVRLAAAQMLTSIEEINDETRQQMLTCLEDEVAFVKLLCAKALIQHNLERAACIKTFESLLSETDSTLVLSSINSLAEMQYSSDFFLSKLKELKKSDDVDVRNAATSALRIAQKEPKSNR